MDLFRPTHLRIRLDQLMSNFRFLQKVTAPQSFLCPMIKANAYGHGDIAVAKALVKEGCEHLGVACVEEGVRLREMNVDCQILVFGFYGDDAVAELLHRKLTPVISNFSQLELLTSQVQESTEVHLKFNTGMNRLGFGKSDQAKLCNKLQEQPLLRVQGLGSHFHSGETLGQAGSSAAQQLKEFDEIVASWPAPTQYTHMFNSSSAAVNFKLGRTFRHGCRPGLLAYGIDPLENQTLKPLIGPVMEFRSKIVGLQNVKSGEVVSYGGTWQAAKNSKVGIVPAGYADGVNRGLSNHGEVLVGGQRVPMLGRVCMDYTMIDLTDVKISDDKIIGQDVVFIGKQGDEEISVNEMSQASGRVNYEILTGISERVPRHYGDL